VVEEDGGKRVVDIEAKWAPLRAAFGQNPDSEGVETPNQLGWQRET
jgi:hypothetical protein